MQADAHLPVRRFVVIPLARLVPEAAEGHFAVFSGAGYFQEGRHTDKQAHARHEIRMASLHVGNGTRIFAIPIPGGAADNPMHAIAQIGVTEEYLSAMQRNNAALTRVEDAAALGRALQALSVEDFLNPHSDLKGPAQAVPDSARQGIAR